MFGNGAPAACPGRPVGSPEDADTEADIAVMFPGAVVGYVDF